MGDGSDDLDDSVEHQRADAEPGGRPHVESGHVAMETGRLVDLLLELGHATTRGDFAVYHRDEIEEARASGYAQGWQDAMRCAGDRVEAAKGTARAAGADVIRIREKGQEQGQEQGQGQERERERERDAHRASPAGLD